MSRTKTATRVSLAAGAVWSVVVFVWNRAGDVAQAREFFENRGPIMEAIGAVLLSDWLGPAVAVGCVLLYLALENQWPARWTADADRRAAVWRAHEARFGCLTGDLYAIWSYLTETGEVFWQIHRGDAGSMRDLQAFEAEASAAGSDVATIGKDAPQKFRMGNASAMETWLNAIGALVEPKADVRVPVRGGNSITRAA